MRVTTAFKRLLRLPGVNVTAVAFEPDRVVVDVTLRRRRLVCPHCGWTTRGRHNLQASWSSWRALDLGVWQVVVRAGLRRIACRPCGVVVVEAVPFARHGARFTRDVEDLVAWLATKMDKTAVTKLVRVNWRTVGTIIERVVADELDPHRLDDLYEVGIDEVSYRKQHNYLTIVADHRTGKVVWADEGKDTKAAERFFDALGERRAKRLQAVSMDMGPAYPKVVGERAAQATICWDPFHVVALGTRELDVVRRAHWNQLRASADAATAMRFKGARWALLKRPEDLTDPPTRRAAGAQARRRRRVARLPTQTGPARHLPPRAALPRHRAAAGPLVLLGATLPHPRVHQARPHRPRPSRRHPRRRALGLTNARVEGLNNRVRLITRRAFGFHSAKAAAALVMLSCGPITLLLPHEK